MKSNFVPCTRIFCVKKKNALNIQSCYLQKSILLRGLVIVIFPGCYTFSGKYKRQRPRGCLEVPCVIKATQNGQWWFYL